MTIGVMFSVACASSVAGKPGKPASAVLVQAETGDTACYLTLRDDRGAETIELADFAICAQKPPLAGKRVALTWREDNVMAAECQGNVDCKKTERVMLVATAQALPPPASHCRGSESIAFTCGNGTRLISICKPAKGLAEYRFGPAGKAEISLPLGKATGGTVTFSGGGGAWLRVTQQEHAYVVYTGIGKWGPRGTAAEKAGVVVERGGKIVANVKCRGSATSELGPDWFTANGITDKGQEFVFPD